MPDERHPVDILQNTAMSEMYKQAIRKTEISLGTREKILYKKLQDIIRRSLSHNSKLTADRVREIAIYYGLDPNTSMSVLKSQISDAYVASLSEDELRHMLNILARGGQINFKLPRYKTEIDNTYDFQSITPTEPLFANQSSAVVSTPHITVPQVYVGSTRAYDYSIDNPKNKAMINYSRRISRIQRRAMRKRQVGRWKKYQNDIIRNYLVYQSLDTLKRIADDMGIELDYDDYENERALAMAISYDAVEFGRLMVENSPAPRRMMNRRFIQYAEELLSKTTFFRDMRIPGLDIETLREFYEKQGSFFDKSRGSVLENLRGDGIGSKTSRELNELTYLMDEDVPVRGISPKTRRRNRQKVQEDARRARNEIEKDYNEAIKIDSIRTVIATLSDADYIEIINYARSLGLAVFDGMGRTLILRLIAVKLYRDRKARLSAIEKDITAYQKIQQEIQQEMAGKNRRRVLRRLQRRLSAIDQVQFRGYDPITETSAIIAAAEKEIDQSIMTPANRMMFSPGKDGSGVGSGVPVINLARAQIRSKVGTEDVFISAAVPVYVINSFVNRDKETSESSELESSKLDSGFIKSIYAYNRGDLLNLINRYNTLSKKTKNDKELINKLMINLSPIDFIPGVDNFLKISPYLDRYMLQHQEELKKILDTRYVPSVKLLPPPNKDPLGISGMSSTFSSLISVGTKIASSMSGLNLNLDSETTSTEKSTPLQKPNVHAGFKKLKLEPVVIANKTLDVRVVSSVLESYISRGDFVQPQDMLGNLASATPWGAAISAVGSLVSAGASAYSAYKSQQTANIVSNQSMLSTSDPIIKNSVQDIAYTLQLILKAIAGDDDKQKGNLIELITNTNRKLDELQVQTKVVATNTKEIGNITVFSNNGIIPSNLLNQSSINTATGYDSSKIDNINNGVVG